MELIVTIEKACNFEMTFDEIASIKSVKDLYKILEGKKYNLEFDIQNKNVIVSGGLSGIGYCIVKNLLKEKANIAIFDINKKNMIHLNSNLMKM